MSDRTPPAPKLEAEEEEEGVLRSVFGPNPPPRWPPPGSWQDEELQRMVKARLIELLAERGIIVPPDS